MRRSSLPLVLALLGALTGRAVAATYVVNTTADTFDGVCDAVSCSLKDAIYEAEQTPQADVIELQTAATYSVYAYSNGINAFAVINTPITIDGHGSTIKHLATLPIVRYFRVGPTGDLTLENLTVRDGFVFNDYGAAIRSEGDLTIDNCQFVNNEATYQGGAIYGIGASVVITRSTFTGNRSHVGGAIEIDGVSGDPATVLVDDSSFESNKAQTTSASGGAIFLRGELNATISDSTFTGNISDVVGGAISFHSIPSTYTVDLVDLTVAGNTSYATGGGLFAHNCTGPTCPTLTKPRLTNVILANNLDLTTNSPNCGGDFFSVGHNIIGGPNGSCAITAPVDPPDYSVTTLTNLGTTRDIGDAGGLFAPPLATCQAVDTADLALSAATDQLDLVRVGASSDVGAVEYRGCLPPPTGMIDWWHFDEVIGTVAFDIAGSMANPGLHTNGVASTTKGIAARARCFNGINQRMTVADNPDVDFAGDCAIGAADPFTIDAWVKTVASGRQTILDKRQSAANFLRGYMLFIQDGQLGFQMATGTGNSLCGTAGSACEEYLAPLGVDLRDNRWHHVAVVVSRCPSVIGELYVDGALALSFSPLTGDLANTAALFVGDSYPVNGTIPPLRGCLDEVEMFRRALSPTEIASLYQAGWAGKCKPPGTEVGSSPLSGCAYGVAKGVHAVGTTTGRMAQSCLHLQSLYDLSGSSVQECLDGDLDGKVRTALGKLPGIEAKWCEDVVVASGPITADTGAAVAPEEALALFRDLFGVELDTALKIRFEDPVGAGCQDIAWKNTLKVFDAKLKIFDGCLKKLFRAGVPTTAQLSGCVSDATNPLSIAAAWLPDGKMFNAGLKLNATMRMKCANVDVPSHFPGTCSQATTDTLGQCFEKSIECRACRLLTKSHRLVVDCDVFDDGVANASCAS